MWWHSFDRQIRTAEIGINDGITICMVMLVYPLLRIDEILDFLCFIWMHSGNVAKEKQK